MDVASTTMYTDFVDSMSYDSFLPSRIFWPMGRARRWSRAQGESLRPCSYQHKNKHGALVYDLCYPLASSGLIRGSALKDRLVGLVVKASASRAEDPGFESRLCRDFFGVESYQ